jgi:hypothetical protein
MDAAAKAAKHGEKMIEVRLRFWTDELAGAKGQVLPGHAWAAGVAHIERNPTHGITPDPPVPFNLLLGVGAAIEKVLIQHGVTLHPTSKMRRYLKTTGDKA